ncbi:MAG: hypothetical protein F6K42_39340, partial [Leptolyngbya sp. SIO1D8]|nr:hypothetical protein [Leptolyngbya sp. SIO1D8]
MSAVAQVIQSVDTAPNEQFSDRITVEPGVTRIFGHLTPPDISDAVYATDETLKQGEVDSFTISDLPPSQSFWVVVDTSHSNMDPIMGRFDDNGNLLDFD